jgi:hypothetical protein
MIFAQAFDRGGVFDESAPRETLVETALAKAARYAELPRAAFATIKGQLKGATLSAIVSALREGREALREHWISDETIADQKAALTLSLGFPPSPRRGQRVAA